MAINNLTKHFRFKWSIELYKVDENVVYRVKAYIQIIPNGSI